MREETFARLAHHLRGRESPRPEFVEALYADLVARLDTRPTDEGRDPAERPPMLPLGTVVERVRSQRSGWRIAASAALVGLLAFGIPALLLRPTGVGTDPAATTAVTTNVAIELTPGRPIGVGVVGAVDAYYILYLPMGFDSSVPIPVVLSLGAESGGHSGGLGFWGPDNADTLGVAVVSVAPTGHTWGYPATAEEASLIEDTWIGGPPPVGSADVAMIEAVLNDIEMRLPVGDVFLVGEYRGALMAGRVACEFPDRISAIAGHPNAVYVPSDCDPVASAVPRMSIGPAEGGAVEPFTAANAAATLAGWGSRSGCADGAETSPADGVAEVRYSACIGGAEHLVVLTSTPVPTGWEDPITAIWRFFAEASGS